MTPKQHKRIKAIVALFVGVVATMLIAYLVCHMHVINFESTILRVQCQLLDKDSNPVVKTVVVEYGDLPQSLQDDLMMLLKEDSCGAFFDVNTYAYPTGISVVGDGYKVYVLKNVTVFVGIGLGQYSAAPRETHVRCFDELRNYVLSNGKCRQGHDILSPETR